MAAKRMALADGFGDAVAAAAAVLDEGGIVVFPSETVYGVGAAFGDAGALARLRRLKGRDAVKPFQILVSGLAMGEAMGAVFPAGARRLAERYWPGPLTLVTPTRTPGETLGLRVPDDAFVAAVLDRLGRGIVAASANPAGAPAPTAAAAADAFGDDVRLLVDGGPCRVGTASSVVAAGIDDGFVVLREGALSRDEIAGAWGSGPRE